MLIPIKGESLKIKTKGERNEERGEREEPGAT